MDELITVELKQLQSGLVRQNGDFTSILTRPIEITEGTSININKVFIDSVSETQASVLVPEDLNFTFSANIYNVNWNNDGKTYSDTGQSEGVTIDGKKYIACNKAPTGQIFSGFTITRIEFFNVRDSNWGGVNPIFEFKDVNNAKQKIQLELPAFVYNPEQFPVSVQLSIISTDGILTLETPTIEQLDASFNTKILSITTAPITGDVFKFTPHEFKKTFLVRAGSYDPNFFAKEITDNLTENKINAENLGTAFNPVDNPFLIASNTLTASNNFTFVDSETGLNTFTYNVIDPTSGTGGYWIGSNQMSLEFADERFYWSNLHMPMYMSSPDGNGGGSKIIKYIIAGNTGEFCLPICANSGLIWSSITTDSKDPKFINFFENILGFKDTITKATPTFETVSLTAGEIALIPIYNWNRDNFTQGLSSIDVPVRKTTGDFYEVQNSLNFSTIIDDETQGVYAQSIFSQSGFSFGYYQISINSIFKHILIGTDIKRTISAIVSRYYENNSFCTGTISDSLNYVHTGEPVNLSALDIRILDSNGKAVAGLGDDNSIYLEIIRPPPQPIQPMVKDKKDK